MARGLALALLSSLLLPEAHAQSDPLKSRFEAAYYAWENGRYVEALELLEQVLTAPGGDRFLEPIALLTGELYPAVEIAPDGYNVRWSPDGRYAVYETGSGAEQTTHIVALEGGQVRRVASIPRSRGLVFAPSGDRVAYLAVTETPAIRAARAEFERAIQANDRAAALRARDRVALLEAEAVRVVERELRTGREREYAARGLAKWSLAYGPDGQTLFLAASPADDATRSDIYVLTPALRALTDGPGLKRQPVVLPGGRFLLYTIGSDQFAVRELATGETRTFQGASPAFSANGSTLVYLSKEGSENTVVVLPLRAGGEPVVVARTARPVAAPALSPDGRRVVYQALQPREDWELYVVGSDGSNPVRLTREIQHDLFPRFLTNDRILAVMGEARHRRSYLYDAVSPQATPSALSPLEPVPANGWQRRRLFHNNTVRTVAPEYEWAPSPDGSRILIVSERNGNTISPERGVYLVDLNRKVTKEEVLERLRVNLAAERDLRERGRKLFEAIEAEVRAAVRDVDVARIYTYERDLYQFDSKYITQPGNRLAIEYIASKLREFGYEPELQWFEPAPGLRTANVVATLRGTENPELIYVVSSHFDSVEGGPGSDDDTSGAAALLEAARVLAGRPQPATIQFAFFTGEEAGLLGSREFVRRAVARGDRIMGALNNDMIGYANDHRLDNTIRYSNAGIRDLQHAAAFLFTDLITYDAEYYKNTDAHAYYEAYGDIVGGIGSYPILANPHYHQPHDVLETVDHRLIAEVSKTTVASIMRLAHGPARLTGLEVRRRGGDRVEVRWTPAPERGVRSYVVAYGPPEDPFRQRVTVSAPRVELTGVGPGTVVAVKAVTDRGLEGWDWARAVVR